MSFLGYCQRFRAFWEEQLRGSARTRWRLRRLPRSVIALFVDWLW